MAERHLGAEATAAEMDAVLRRFEVPHRFPPAARSQAEEAGDELRPADRRGRADLRDVGFVTIDGADARDFDDALHAERRPDGWRLRVAIADVGHYVPAGSPLDVEARRRGTSVYLPGRVVPMLPVSLSNGLCSLNPQVDRLALVCDMHLEPTGRVSRARFLSAVVRSHARLTYDALQLLLDGDAGLRARHAAVLPSLLELKAVWLRLDALRVRRGALDLEQVEPQFRLDRQGRVVAIESRPRLAAHRVVEEAMILANVEAARFLHRHRVPALYRAHDAPDALKMALLRAVAARLGLPLGGGVHPAPRHVSRLLQAARGRPGELLLRTLLGRALGRAEYRAEVAPHFGLALQEYTHFTSPIRRYPDLLVHRAIAHALAGGSASDYAHGAEEMQGLGPLCSLLERRADEAVRDVHAWLKCLYLQDAAGQVFDGHVSAVADFGLFVRLGELPIEGLVHVSELGDDFFELDAATQRLVGRGTGRSYELGGALRVRCKAVRCAERRIDLVLEDAPPHVAPARGRPPVPPTSRNRRRGRPA